MTNFIKKITVALVSMIVVAGVFAPFASVFAAAFNNDAQDYPTLQVSNYTQNPGSNVNWSNSVSANAGEVISFLMYYHNTAADTANNTFVRTQLPGGPFTSTTVSGDVRATNASTVSGTVSVNLTSSQTITFVPGSVSWYPNKSAATQALLNGQNGSEIVSANGLSVGNIAGGWATQGYVVFRAQVNNGGGTGGTGGGNGSVASVSTNTAISVAQNSATLQGAVNPNNSNTTAWFEYGTTQSFGNTAGNQTVGSGNVSTSISGYAYNLSANTTYYYRAVAQNSYGISYGNVLSFTTQSSGTGGGNGTVASVSTNAAVSISQSYATLQGAVNPNNSNTTAWFEYGTTQSFGNQTGYQTVGSGNVSTSISGYAYNLSANTTYYYRAVAQNSYGTTHGNVLSFTTQSSGYGTNGSAPLVYTTNTGLIATNSATLNGSVNPNNSQTNAWFEYGTTQSLGYTSGYQSIGSSNYASSFTTTAYNLAANTTYYYRAVAQNSYGTTYGNTLSFITTGSSVGSGIAPYVTTHAAQSVFRNSALISGAVNPNGSLGTAWFDWGSTTSLGNRTIIQPVGQATYSDIYSAVLSGLQAGTTYYYRAVAQNSYGTAYGNILTFTTTSQTGTPVVSTTPSEPRIIIQQTQVSGTIVVLTPSIDKKNPGAGDSIEYSIQYRNETSKAITNATMKVSLPKEVTYDSATIKPSMSQDNELTFDLGTVGANTQGVIVIKATIDRTVDADSALIFGATMNFTDAKKQFQSATAYLTVMVGSGIAGLASLISILGNLFTTWFIDLILGLLIGFGIYHFFIRQKEEVLIK